MGDLAEGRFDMHVHTTSSDGIWTPAEIVRMAKERGLAGLAVTDHDTLDGLSEAAGEAAKLGLRLIYGVEMSTDNFDADGGIYEVHMLGYFPGAEPPAETSDFMRRLRELQNHRWTRGLKMLEKLAELGMPLDRSFLADYADSGTLGRGLLARKLVEAGYVQDREEVFEKWLSPGCPAYVAHQRLTPKEAVQLIHSAGGVAVMAHPIQAGHDEIVAELAAAGLDGLECRHPDQPGALQERYLRMAAGLGLAVSGGSDCHDGGLGDFTISGAELENLLRV